MSNFPNFSLGFKSFSYVVGKYVSFLFSLQYTVQYSKYTYDGIFFEHNFMAPANLKKKNNFNHDLT